MLLHINLSRDIGPILNQVCYFLGNKGSFKKLQSTVLISNRFIRFSGGNESIIYNIDSTILFAVVCELLYLFKIIPLTANDSWRIYTIALSNWIDDNPNLSGIFSREIVHIYFFNAVNSRGKFFVNAIFPLWSSWSLHLSFLNSHPRIILSSYCLHLECLGEGDEISRKNRMFIHREGNYRARGKFFRRSPREAARGIIRREARDINFTESGYLGWARLRWFKFISRRVEVFTAGRRRFSLVKACGLTFM